MRGQPAQALLGRDPSEEPGRQSYELLNRSALASASSRLRMRAPLLEDRHLLVIGGASSDDRPAEPGQRLPGSSAGIVHRPKLPTLVAIIGNRRVLRGATSEGSDSTMPVAVAMKS